PGLHCGFLCGENGERTPGIEDPTQNDWQGACHRRYSAYQSSRPAALCRFQGCAAGVGWNGNFDFDDVPGNHDRPRGEESQCGRGTFGVRVVMHYVTNW